MKKRVFSLALALVMVLITLVIPASVTVSARGNGYESISFKFNGKDYYGNLITHYDPAKGGWTSFYTEAAIKVELDGPEVKYETKNYGYKTYRGRFVSEVLSSFDHVAETEPVPCKVGMNQVIRCASIYGYVAIYPNGVMLSTSVMGTPA